MRSFHPYSPFIPPDATRLIIGSLPPERFCLSPKQLKDKDVYFFYGSKDNHFWRLLEDISQTKLNYENSEIAIAQRMNLLITLSCGITDIIASCVRMENNASDSNLKDIVFQPILQYQQEHPTINTFIYTSHFAQTKVYQYFTKIFGKNWKKEVVNDDIRHHQLYFPNGLVLNDFTLYSPSPQALKGLGKNGKEKRLEQYREIFAS